MKATIKSTKWLSRRRRNGVELTTTIEVVLSVEVPQAGAGAFNAAALSVNQLHGLRGVTSYFKSLEGTEISVELP